MHFPQPGQPGYRESCAAAAKSILFLACFGALFAVVSCRNPALQKVITDPSSPSNSPASWPMSGQNLGDTRNQPAETTITNSNVGSLAVKWAFTTAGGVSATPTVVNSRVFFPDWAGNLYSVNAKTGQQLWLTQISNYTGIANDVSRVSPAVYNSELILGDDLSESGPHDGARLFAVDQNTGKLLWLTKIDSHPAAIVTGPPVVYNGVVYQGVSSDEEQYATDADYPCCTFRGSIVAVDAATGKVLWKTYTIPDNQGAVNQYSGGAIWQPPVIDTTRDALYVATGNNYTVPASVESCQQSDPNATNCATANDHFDSALAMNLQTGAILWATRLFGYDAWTVACLTTSNPNACPNPPGPDDDFAGAGGNLMAGVVGFGEKSGFYWALNTSDGSIVWGTQVGPHGNLGGVQWGTATDGQRIYVPITNNEHFNYLLANGQTITGSAWNALDPATGKILWQTPDPAQGSSFNMAAVSVANGVLYSGAMDGHMYAIDAATGKILWSYLSGGTVLDGPAIVNAVIYWGSGYPRSGGTDGNMVYAFSLPRSAP
jgi:polyvinyl alcohol dehydrogenase (cytochrome)